MINYTLVEEKLNEEAKKILLFIKEDYYKYMSIKNKSVIDNLIETGKIVEVNQGISHFNDNTLAHGGRTLNDGKIHFYPDARGYDTEEAIEKCKKILLHECFHYFIQPDETKLKDKLEKEMASFFVEGLVEKEARKFYENHKEEIDFEKANYGYNINFVNAIQDNLGASSYEIIFSEDDYIKNIGIYSSVYRKNLKQKERNFEIVTEISKKFPIDVQRRMAEKMKNIISKDGNAIAVKEKLKTLDFISNETIEQLDTMYRGTIAESWKPTFENVAREFITEILYEILFSDEVPNFRIEFREDEAINFIEKVLKDYVQQYDFYKEKSEKILQKIKEKCSNNTEKPVMIVNDYKEFFEQLRQYYEKNIELFFIRTKMSGFTRYEKDNCFEHIWLRATPDDFINPEKFLKKQVDMINDETLKKYDEETCLGKVNFLDNNILCVKNSIARTWDENSREFEITIYDKEYYNNTQLFSRPHYSLPVIRYGIYEKDGRKVCSIGSIQDKSDNYEKNDFSKNMNRKRYKVNKDVPEEDFYQVEPKNILALSIFINLLNKEGINQIEVPSLYVLDYEYHEKRNEKILSDFKKEWTEEKIKKFPDVYKRRKYYFERTYEKQDLISEIKSERLSLTFRRLLYHYPKGNIKSYPGDVDNFMHLEIPTIKNKDDIKGEVFKELYELQNQQEIER